MSELNRTPAPGSTAPSDEQIQSMLEQIFGMSDKATSTDNTDLYNAHTDVLQNRLSADDARAKYGVNAEGSEDAQFDPEEMESILGCGDWLEGKSDRDPAASFAQLLADDVSDDNSENEGERIEEGAEVGC